MTYDPTIWKDRITEKPNTFKMQENVDGTVTLVPVPGQIMQQGTPVNAKNLNKIENRLVDITSQFADALLQVSQNSFLEIHERFTQNYGKPLYRVNGDRNVTFLFPIGVKLGEIEYSHYRFQKDTNDDFIKGREDAIYSEKNTANDNYGTISDGTMKGTTTDNHYADTVGTKLSNSFTGTGVDVQYYFDDRGGVWEIRIDGVLVDTFTTHIDGVPPADIIDATSNARARRRIRGLSDGLHNIEMKFIGEDPKHPPSTTPARGWTKFKREVSNVSQSTYRIFSITEDFSLTSNSSNIEFAFATTSAWIPDHGIGTAFLGTTGFQDVLIDGVKLSDFTPTGFKPFNNATITQELEIKMPSDTEQMAILTHTANIEQNTVTRYGKMKFLLQKTINTGYVNMLPATSTFGQKLTSSKGKSFPTILDDGSFTELSDKEDSLEYVFTSDDPSLRNYYTGVAFLDFANSRRLNKPNVGITAIQHRADNIQKLYPKIYDGHTVQPGEVIKFGGVFFVGKIPEAATLFTQ